MKSINIYELHNEISKKKEKRTKCFDIILEQCHAKIKQASKKELSKMYFDVPEYVVGLPMFDLTNCISHLVNCLQQNGFLVEYFFPKLLYISWDFDEINKKSQPQTPSMKDETERLLLNSKANLIMKPTSSKQLEYRPNGKFVLNLD